MSLVLREHQKAVIEALREGFKQGHRSQLLYAATGFGKTEVAIALMKATSDNYKNAAMVLDRIVLVDQTSLRLTKYNINHGVYQAGHWKYDRAERLQVCSAQTLERRDDFPKTQLLIIDECFTGDTLISTPSGTKMISNVRCGDIVYNSVGIGIVEAVSIKPTNELYRLEFDNGTITECTGNHPFFTEFGWIKARELEVGRVFFSEQGLRLLWEGFSSEYKDRLWEESFLYELGVMESPANLLKVLLKEVKEPNAQYRVSSKDAEEIERNQAQAYQTWGQRAITAFATISNPSCTGGGMGGGAISSNPQGTLQRDISESLQDRHSKSINDDRNRAGRGESWDFREKESGQEKNRLAHFPRLVNISHIKRESVTSVFNLQVSGHPSYFADGKLVHNCHIARKQTSEFIKNNPDIKVIGLTATPFTKGLGELYTNVVSGMTTSELVSKGWLAPLKVFIAKEIDMTGAKKVAGEWAQDVVTERGMKITGDIVNEWIKKTHEVFGRPRKTIVFCSGVAHGADLVEQFAKHGYNFVSISYKDDDEFKKLAIEDFSKPDTEIHGLIATDILTRGFDVPDVMIGVSARPFSKSLSSHVQQMGRVMRPYDGKDFALWLCMAKGSKVLTDKGLIPIDKVKLHHKIWDGANFVNHEGAVCNGIQEVITYQGLTATEGHLVHTAEGWLTFGECASKQIRITQTGFGGTAIRLGENIRPASFLVGSKAQKIYTCFLRVCNLWIQKSNITIKFTKWENKRMQGLQSARASISNVALRQSSSNESKMLFQFMRPISSVWWKRNKIQLLWSKARDYVDYGKSWASRVFISGGALTYATGQDKSKWALRSWKFAMAFSRVKPAQQTWKSIGSKDAQIQNGLPSNSLFRQYIEAFLLGWNDSRTNNREIPQAISKAKREVWDILNCGQNNRFTCEGLLVHNCHSGNYLRFRDDWDEVYEDGVKSLDDRAEKAKREPTEKEKKESKCPACSSLWSKYSDTCLVCGFVRKRRNDVSSVAGEMVELNSSNKAHKDDKQAFYSELMYIAKDKSYNINWASHKYREKFGVWPKGLQDVVKFPSRTTLTWIQHKNIAWAKKQNKIGVTK